MDTKRTPDGPLPPPPAHRRPLSRDRKEHMLAILIRNPQAFAAVSTLLTATALEEGMGRYAAAVWRTVVDFHGRYGALPPPLALESAIQQLVNDHPTALTDDEIDETNDFLHRAFTEADEGVEGNSVQANVAVDVARVLLQEILARQASGEIATGTKVASALPELLERLSTQSRAIDSLTAAKTGPVFPTGWQQRSKPALVPTGVGVVDRFIGGMIEGETYLIMGPYGSCKTLLAVQAICRAAEDCFATHKAGQGRDGHKPVVCYVSYEPDLAEFQRRVLCFLAQIPMDRLMRLPNYRAFRKAHQPPAKYELKLFQTQREAHEPFPCEQERVDRAAAIVNAHVIFLDLTGSQEATEHEGKGGIDELGRRIRAEMRGRPGEYLYTLWVDHIAEMCDKHNAVRGGDQHTLRLMLREAPREAKRLVGRPLRVPIFLLHQLSGAANELGPTAQLKQTQADGCKSLAMVPDFTIVISKPTEDKRQLCTFTAGKHRRKPPTTGIVVSVQGAWGKVSDMTGKFYVDHGRRQSLTPEELGIKRGVDPRLAAADDDGDPDVDVDVEVEGSQPPPRPAGPEAAEAVPPPPPPPPRPPRKKSGSNFMDTSSTSL